jgi:hypothetical protein
MKHRSETFKPHGEPAGDVEPEPDTSATVRAAAERIGVPEVVILQGILAGTVRAFRRPDDLLVSVADVRRLARGRNEHP